MRLPLCLAVLFSFLSSVRAEPPTPQTRLAAEQAEPFCYFLVPSDVLGFKDCPEGTQVTVDGAFNTGFGELALLIGNPPQPVHQRVKTLLDGHMPVIKYSFVRGGAQYEVQAFAAPVDLDPRDNLVNHIRIRVANPGDTALETAVEVRFVKPEGKTRHPLSCQAWYRDRFMDHAAYRDSVKPDFADGMVFRGSHLVFIVAPGDADWTPVANVDFPAVTCELSLKPGESRVLDLKLPYVPVSIRKADRVRDVVELDRGRVLTDTLTFWKGVFDSALEIELPERKVVDTMKASLVYDLIARDITEDGNHFVQKVNEFQYDHFYPRDSAYFIRTYDLLGLHQVAEETLDHFLVRNADGKPIKLLRKMPDDWGQSLWSIGAHYRSTGDLAFAKRVYPAIPPHVAAFRDACSKDPLKLWPVAGPYDNEAITGHYTGHSFWALLGLREAINLAKAVGAESDAAEFRALRDAYRERFMKRLKWITDQCEGYIPPGLDDPEAGFDWANASAGVFPFEVFKPHDPLVTATVRMVREYKYQEGIMTYGTNAWSLKKKARANQPLNPGWLHHYETIYLVQTLLARGEQRKVIEDFYSILAHTGSTNSGFEFSIMPWSDRDPGGNRPPHGWFAARFMALLRNMLLREDGEQLHIASALSPEWVGPGQVIRVKRGATLFGEFAFEMKSTATGTTVTFNPKWRKPPRLIRFHVPWFVKAGSASADGKTVSVVDGFVDCPPGTGKLEIKWEWIDRPALSYRAAVAHFLRKYHLRGSNEDYAFLFPTPRRPRTDVVGDVFIDSLSVNLKSPGGQGEIHYTLDGSTPGPDSTRYTKPIPMTETTTINAISVWSDGRTSEPMSVTFRKVVPRPAETPGKIEPGLICSYFEGRWTKLPVMSLQSAARQLKVAGCDLASSGHRPDDFGVVFSGYLKVEQDGVYTFYTASDDGSRLLIGDELVVDNDGLHRYAEENGIIALAAGLHPIRVAFFERGGVERLTVSHAGPGFAKREIPQASFFRVVE